MDKNLLDRIVSFFVELAFSKEKSAKRWLLLLILIGFILRLIAALNLGAFPDDMVHGSQSAGIISSKILSTHSTPPLFFYLNDLSFKIFGYTTFALRFFPLIFGTLLIPLIFIITRKLFNEKIALAAAFFATFSNLLIRMTISEQSLDVLFFSFFAIYIGLNYLEKRTLSLLSLSAIFFGLALLTKYSAPFFILSFLVFSAYSIKSKKERIFTKKNIKHLIIFLLIISLFSFPLLSFNYFIYKEKGIVDIYFSRIVQLETTQQLYGSLAGQGDTFFDNLQRIEFYGNIFLIYYLSIIFLIFSLMGLIIMLKLKCKYQLAFFFIFFFIPYIFQTGGSPLTKHFVFMPFLFSIPAGFALQKIFEKINKKIFHIILIIILVALLTIDLGNRFGTPTNYFSESDISQVKSFLYNNVNENDFIVFDTRIYTSQMFWFATPNHFLNLHAFMNFYSYNQNLSNEYKTPVKVYVVECAVDDCGWGTIRNQPDLNESSEKILDGLKQNAQLIKSISSFDYEGNELTGAKKKSEKYKIYAVELGLNPQLIKQTDYMNAFYFAPYMYKNMKDYVFNYSLDNSFDNFLNTLSYYIILFAMFLSIMSIILIAYYLFKSDFA